MGNPQTYQIFALGQGWRKCDTSILMHLTDIGRPARIAYYFWALVPEGGTNGKIPILVDVGFLESHYQRRYPDLEDYRRPGDLLAPFDIRPYEVESVILTHLHWDHFSACRLYSSANFYLQEKELAFWRSPASDHFILRAFLADMSEADWLEKEGRLRLVGEFSEIADGVTVHRVGGHTPGGQIVRVRTKEGWGVLAADAAFTFRSFERMIPPGEFVHLDEAAQALDTVKELADRPSLIFPGHDISTVKGCPELDPGVWRLA